MGRLDETPLYQMETQTSSPSRKTVCSKEELREYAAEDERLCQFSRWAPRVLIGVGAIYLVAGALGYQLPFPFIPMENYTHEKQTTAALVTILAARYFQAESRDSIARWESRINAFNTMFPAERVELVPEKYHPLNLLKKANPLQLLKRR